MVNDVVINVLYWLKAQILLLTLETEMYQLAAFRKYFADCAKNDSWLFRKTVDWEFSAEFRRNGVAN